MMVVVAIACIVLLYPIRSIAAPIMYVETAPPRFPIIVTIPSPIDFNSVGNVVVTAAYIVGENEYRLIPINMSTRYNVRLLLMIVSVKIIIPLMAVAMHIAFFLPIFSAMYPLEILAMIPTAGMMVAINPAVCKLSPLYSTRYDGVNMKNVLRARLYIE